MLDAFGKQKASVSEAAASSGSVPSCVGRCGLRPGGSGSTPFTLRLDAVLTERPAEADDLRSGDRERAPRMQRDHPVGERSAEQLSEERERSE